MDVLLHPDLSWDYRNPPQDPLWRLQRIADVFPAYGRERQTVGQLFTHRDELKVRPEVYTLIGLYEECWREEEARGGRAG